MEGTSAVREKLILAGIREIEENGIQSFSLRRVAQSCGLSCAAPYKHFRDKQALIEAVVEYLNRQWFARQEVILQNLGDDTGAKLRVICKEYLRFLCENPDFCNLVTQRDQASGRWHLNHLFDQSSLTKSLIAKYAEEHRMTSEDVYRRVYAIRAVLYGSAMMNQHDDMRLTESTLQSLYEIIDSQFLIYDNV